MPTAYGTPWRTRYSTTICAPERRRGASSTWIEAGDARSCMATFDTSAAGSAAGGQTFTWRAAPRIAGADADGNRTWRSLAVWAAQRYDGPASNALATQLQERGLRC